MKSLRLLPLIGLTSLFIGCASDNKSAQSGNDMPVAGNTATAPAAQPSEPLPATTTVQSSGPVTQASGATEAAPTATVDYTVVSGDSLWKIARAHKTSVAKLKTLNSLTSDKLKPGDVIKVPAQ